MNKIKRRHNWKSRRIVETKIDDTQTKKIKLDLPECLPGQYDESNQLVLPSQKRKTKVKVDAGLQPVKKPLSRKKKKKLEKILEAKKKKVNRAQLFEALAKVQATPEEMKFFVATADMQTKGFKRHSAEQVKIFRTENEDTKISSVRGSNKRKRGQEIFKTGSRFPEEEETDDSSTTSEEEDEEEHQQKQDKTEDEEKVETLQRAEEGTGVNHTNPKQSVSEPEPVATANETEASVSGPQTTVPELVARPTAYKPVNRPPEIQESRMNLPILAEEQVIMEAIHDNQFVVLCGETGSGKTTQVPQFLYEAGYTNDGQMIGITEPRRVAATVMSQRVAEEMGLSPDVVSYQIRYEGNVTDKTEIKFMTDGVLLKEIQNDFLLSRYSVIVIDEAHERSVFTDILIGLLSRIVPLRNKKKMPFRMVIMSATLRVEDFTENRCLFKTPPPVIQVSSRQYPVSVHFNRKTPDDYVLEAYRKACKIHRQLPPGGLLIFVTGQQEVNTLCHKLQKTFPRSNWQTRDDNVDGEEPVGNDSGRTRYQGPKIRKDTTIDNCRRRRSQPDVVLPKISLDDYAANPNLEEEDAIKEADNESDAGDLHSDDEDMPSSGIRLEPEQPLFVLPLYSLLPPYRQARVFRPPPKGCRLCVVSTNVAETSVTIPNIKYVVDTGKVKTRVYDRVTGVSTFLVSWTSKAAANQRAGRAGRIAAGHCYRLYSSAIFNDEFEKFAPPEICRRPVDDLVLQLKEMSIDRVVNFPFPTPVDAESIKASERRLILLGALERPPEKVKRPAPASEDEEFCAKITTLGHAMACFPVAPRYAKMLALSHQHGLLPYAICAVAALAVQEVLQESNIIAATVEEKKDAKSMRARWMQIRKAWAGQRNSLLLGDVSVLLRAVGAAEYAGCTPHFCAENGLRLKAMKEIRKLRVQLTNVINCILPDANLSVDPKMLPPTDMEAKLLRQILLNGLPDCIARKVDESELRGDDEEKQKWRKAYKAADLEQPVFIHPNSVLFREMPEFIVYQEIFETTKMYMKGVSAIEPSWIMIFCPRQCTFSKPLDQPPPHYDPITGKVKCHITAAFGRAAWQLPMAELDYPEGADRVRWFARFFLEGQVCPKLERFRKELLTTASTMVKSWARLQPRTHTILRDLLSAGVDSRDSLLTAWETDSRYLLDGYLEWLPSHVHTEVQFLWPPL